MREEEVAVSVIVPVFNTEDYLGECLDSILSQRVTDIEVLCVDDGSTDRSVSILEDYAQRDPRVKIVPQRPGGKGPGTARNTALEQARGRHIAFVDSDDAIHKDMLFRLSQVATEHDAEIAIGTIAKFSPSSKKERFSDCTFKLIPPELDGRTFSWTDIQDVLFDLRFVAPNKLYRRDFLTKWNVRFSDGIFYEDMIFSFKAMLSAERIRFVRKPPLYYNRKEREGQTTFTRGSRAFDVLAAMEQVAELLESRPEYEPLQARFEAFRFKKLYGYMYKNDSEHLIPYYARLREHASSPSLDDSPYLREWEMRKRMLIQENELLDFLAHELWEAKNRNASLLRQRRKLQEQTRLFRLWSGGKRRVKAVLRRLRPPRPTDSVSPLPADEPAIRPETGELTGQQAQ